MEGISKGSTNATIYEAHLEITGPVLSCVILQEGISGACLDQPCPSLHMFRSNHDIIATFHLLSRRQIHRIVLDNLLD